MSVYEHHWLTQPCDCIHSPMAFPPQHRHTFDRSLWNLPCVCRMFSSLFDLWGSRGKNILRQHNHTLVPEGVKLPLVDNYYFRKGIKVGQNILAALHSGHPDRVIPQRRRLLKTLRLSRSPCPTGNLPISTQHTESHAAPTDNTAATNRLSLLTLGSVTPIEGQVLIKGLGTRT